MRHWKKLGGRPASDHSRRDGEAGVTLIEMMVVLVIIALVAAIIVPNVIGRPDEARVTVAQSDIRAVGSALELYRLDNRTYPTTAQGLQALAVRPTAPPEPRNWVAGGYLTAVPVDPWGNDYIYVSPGANGGFDLMSLGADGAPGGEGVAADLAHGQLQASK
ncbi:type II secretion system major pseudopilin GspG [Sulfitobacter pontiacus]|jgi:general secretion pathway protein G|uniref:type II secretion system major pseudopilin GspG n=1 Tax=Sulfitobacter pontiacus TaxID=60137 RepID=UPI000EC520C4|nr:type II secretion system protein GspG [Sulfitobacter sp.]